MENDKSSLQTAIEVIKRKLEITQQKMLTDEEIAQKLGISKPQLEGYLNGNKNVPEEIESHLLSLYGLKRRTVEHKVEHFVYIPPEDEAENEK